MPSGLQVLYCRKILLAKNLLTIFLIMDTRSRRYPERKRKAVEPPKKKKPVKKKKKVSFSNKENLPKTKKVPENAEQVASVIAKSSNVISVRNLTDKVLHNYTGNTKEHDRSKNCIHRFYVWSCR